MSYQRFSGSLLGLPKRLWGTLLFVLIFLFIIYQYISSLNRKIVVLDGSREKMEKAITKLQLDSIDISHRRLANPEDSDGPKRPNTDPQEDLVVFYNRVPKTGSTTFAGITYDLCVENKFHVVHMNITRNQRVMSLSDQRRFAMNITNWNEKKPAIYHGHVAFIDFSKFGIHKSPVYVNMVRQPLDRLISYYYFVRYGDDFRPFLKRRKAGDNETFDECVERGGDDCDPEHLWVQIPYFCGHHEDCWEPGNKWALEEAKRNLLHHYFLVGTTEEMRDFVVMLEVTLPRFFKGATQLYDEGRKSHLRKTAKKVATKQSTIEQIQQSHIWKMENEFYEYAVNHFHYLRRLTFESKDGEMVPKGQKFMFEKIRPK